MPPALPSPDVAARPDASFRPSGALVLPDAAPAPVIDGAAEPHDHAPAPRRGGGGDGDDILQLALRTAPADLPPGLAWLRAIGRRVLERLRRMPDLDDARAVPDLTPPADDVATLLGALPMVVGAEYVTRGRIEELWRGTEAALRAEVAASGASVGGWLAKSAPELGVVGRVCFHLVEDASDAARPFAFLATYTTRLSGDGAARHRPLGRALQEYAAATDRDTLLSLLRPIRRAAETSALVREMVESEEIYAAARWTPARALALLRQMPALEAAGILLRVPDWWRARRGAHPTVRVTVGGAPPVGVGADALLEFRVDCVLDGEPLSAEEWALLTGSADGLVRLRGRWVEVDGARLGGLLDRWKEAEKAAREGGLTFVEGLRLLAGTSDGPAGAAVADAETADWVETAAGPWLAERLARLRSNAPAEAPIPGLRADLRPYQQRGVAWLAALTELGLGGCLADDMGLGKTLQVLALFARAKSARAQPARGESARGESRPRPHLVIVPASLLANWTAEAARFAPDLRFLVAHPSFTPRERLAAVDDDVLSQIDVVLTTYGTLGRLAWISATEWDVVVADEAQAIKNPGAQQTRSVKRVRARARFALTGTPVENRLGDLWSVLDFACPGLLGGAREFSRFVKRLDTDAAGYGRLRELIRPYVLRRLKSDPEVAPDLPDKTEMRVRCVLTAPQAALYEKVVARLAASLEERPDAIRRRGLVLATILGLKQICNHPDQWLGTGAFDPRESGKLQRLVEIASEVASRQEKLLLFTQFREMTAPLAAHLAAAFGAEGRVLHGGTPVRERGRLVREFQGEDGPPYLVLSLKAGGTGLNLTAAQHVVHFDRWWNPAVEDQATDRAYRIGQTRNVLVHKLVCAGTVEEKIDELIEAKRELAAKVVGEGGGPEVLTELSDEDLLRAIRLDLAAVSAET